MCYKQKCKVVSLNLAHPVYESVYEIFLSCSSDSSITYTIGLEDSRTYIHGQLVLGLALKIKYTSPRVWSGLLENTFYSCMTWARTWIRQIATICQWWKHSNEKLIGWQLTAETDEHSQLNVDYITSASYNHDVTTKSELIFWTRQSHNIHNIKMPRRYTLPRHI